MFKCKLQIDGVNRKLSLDDGISFKELAELFFKLSKCLAEDSNNLTLTLIENSSYSPVWTAETQASADKFQFVHRVLSNNNIYELSPALKEYGEYLNKTLLEKGIYIRATIDSSDEIIEIKSIDTSKLIKTYYSITSIFGQIVIINGKDDSKPFVSIKDVRDKVYKIYLNAEQEETLKDIYKKGNVRFRVRLRKVVDSQELEGKLIDFHIPEFSSLFDAIEDTQKSFGDIFYQIKDSAKILSELRNS